MFSNSGLYLKIKGTIDFSVQKNTGFLLSVQKKKTACKHNLETKIKNKFLLEWNLTILLISASNIYILLIIIQQYDQNLISYSHCKI